MIELFELFEKFKTNRNVCLHTFLDTPANCGLFFNILITLFKATLR